VSQAKRSKVLARERWRRQVARLIGLDVSVYWASGGHFVQSLGATSVAEHLLRGNEITFDVHEARELGEQFVTMEAEAEVFADWTRDRGLGPENRERGTFVSVETDADWTEPEPHRHVGVPRRGGWPGKLAREYGWECCSSCEGKGRCRSVDCSVCNGRCGRWDNTAIDQWYRCEACDGSGQGLARCKDCKGRGRVRKHGVSLGFANGKTLARLGRRLLTAIEGQPSECQSCIGENTTIESAIEAVRRIVRERYSSTRVPSETITIAIHRKTYELLSMTRAREWMGGDHPWLAVLSAVHRVKFEIVECKVCCGTGHNLRGRLPASEVSIQTRARVADGVRAIGSRADYEQIAVRQWWTALSRSPSWGPFGEATRVVPRNEHRQPETDEGPNGVMLRDQSRGVQRFVDAVVPRTWTPDAHVRAWMFTRLPRWQRGEHRHTVQQRQRMRRLPGMSFDMEIVDDVIRRGTSTIPIRDAVLAVPSVVQCNVFVDQRQHEIEVFVEGGTDQDIAAALLEYTSALTRLRGTSLVYVDGQPVRFSRP
jgi:hypothetical protein